MTRRFLVLLMSSLVASCGGGGGGGGGGNGGGGGGGTPPFVLTEANAVEAAAYALSSAEEAFVSAVIAVNVGLDLMTAGTTQQTFSCGATQVELSYTDRDSTGTPTAGDIIRFQHGHCAGASRNLSLELTAFEPSTGRVSGTLNFDSTVDPLAFRMAGSFTLSVTADSTATRWGTSNASVTLTSRGTQQTVRIGSIELAAMPTSYRFTTTGGSIDSAALGGSYTFATAAPFTGDRRRLPTAGSLVLSTSSGSRVSIAPPASLALGEATVDYAVAVANAGFGAPRPALWTELLVGDVFDWQLNTAPVISHLDLHPENPAAGATIFATYDATDPNTDDSISFETTWRHNGVVVAGDGRSVTLPTARNDIVEFTLTVRDDRGATTTRSASVRIGNGPPVLTSLSITPPSPDTTTTLVAIADVSDPDGDPLQGSYVWHVNGVVVAGETTATLPAIHTKRFDIVRVDATFRDDALSATGTATIMIGDALPRVAVAGAPVSVAYGMPTTFTASASDPDGDSVSGLRFEVAYGPAGMTVDPVTGMVNWTPRGPMFDRTLEVNWAVTVNLEGSHAATGTVRVEDPARPYPLLRTGIQIPRQPGALRVGDFDGDADTEILLVGLRWLLEIEADGAGGYRQSWAYPFAFGDENDSSTFGAPQTLTTGDVDGDGHHEIFAATDNRIVKLDGMQRRVVASATLRADETCSDLRHGDLDGDGAGEIVCAARLSSLSQRLVIYRASDLSERAALASGPYGTLLALGNVDADAALEIVTDGGYVIDGATTAVQWQRAGGFREVATGNVDGTGPDEIVAAESSNMLAVFRAGNLTPLISVPSELLDTVLVADIDGDARGEILAGTRQNGNVTVYRYDQGAATVGVMAQIDNQNHGVTAFGVGDTDGDAQVEIVWGTGLANGPNLLVVAGLHPGIEVEWINDDLEQLTGPFVGGALARSPTEPSAPLFVTRTFDSGSRLVRLDPLDGTIRTSPALDDSSGGRYSMLAVDDYDQDGTDEALLASVGPFQASPTVYDFFTDTVEWTPAVFDGTVQLASANVYGDVRDELVWLGVNGVVSVLDVATRQLIWQSEALNGARGLRLADRDGSGESEIYAITPSSLHVFMRAAAPDTFQLADSFPLTGSVVDLTVGDADGDGRGEVFILVNPPNPPNSPPGFVGPSIVVRFDSELRPRDPLTLPWRALAIAIEPSTFARKNLLVGRAEGALPAGRLVTVDARNGAVVSESPPLIGGVGRDSAYHVDTGSGAVRLSIGTDAGMYLTR